MSIGQKADSIRAAMRGIMNGGASPVVLAATETVATDPAKKPDDDETMTETAPAEGAASDTPPTPIDPPCGDAEDDEDDGKDKPKEDMAAAATAAANVRWATVLRSPQAAGRTDAAVDLLAESSMGADKITALLGKLPAAASATSFDAKMRAEAPNPDVRPDGDGKRTVNVATRMAERHASKKGN